MALSSFRLSAVSTCSLAALRCTWLRALQQLLQTGPQLRDCGGCSRCRRGAGVAGGGDKKRDWESPVCDLPTAGGHEARLLDLGWECRVVCPFLCSVQAFWGYLLSLCVPFPLPIAWGMGVRENRSLFLWSPGVYYSLCYDVIYF